MLERDNYTWHEKLRPPVKQTINESMLERDKYTWDEVLRPPVK
jgi:hypothetical protein